MPSGKGCMTPPMSPCPWLMMSINALRSKLSAIARRISALSNGGASRLTIRLRLPPPGSTSPIASGGWGFDVLHQRDRGPDPVELAGGKGEVRRRHIANNRMLNPVEKRPALLPVIRVANHRDPFVRLELTKFERARADRMLPHLCRRHVARIDHGIAGSEEGYERRLRPFQMEGRGEISVSGDRFDVLVPSFPRVDAQLLLRLAEKKIPGALDVLSRKGSAVMPFNTVTQPEGQLGSVLAPGPAGGEVGHD